MPLCKHVDCNVQEFKAPGSTREGADDVEPPDRERPGERDGLEGLSWLVNVLGVELACFTSDDHRQGVLKGYRPVESLTKCLADKRARPNVRATHPFMHLF